MSSTKPPGAPGVGPSRRTWDVQEFTAKARERDRQDRDAAAENEARLSKGLAPLRPRREVLPKPTQSLQARKAPLDLDKNDGKTIMVDMAAAGPGGGQRGPGFYCEVCNKTCKDNVAYLDHINGRLHLMRLGQTTQVTRSTLEQVRAKLDSLRKQLNPDGTRRSLVATYDFDARLRAIAEQEEREKEQRRQKRRQERLRKKNAANATLASVDSNGGAANEADSEMMAAMGFAGFGSTKK
ncbi:U4/U6.U5 snRNP associated protein [Thecaphora frezii]